MLKLNQAVRDLMRKSFGEFKESREGWEEDKVQRHEITERAYSQLIQIVLYVNQEAIALNLFSQEDTEDLISVISRIYESRFWRDTAFKIETTVDHDPRYDDMEWLLIDESSGHGYAVLQGAYRVTSLRLLRMCKHSLPLENALIRLMNSYHLGGLVCERGINAIAREQSIREPSINYCDLKDYRDLKKKRQPKPFRLVYSRNSNGQRAKTKRIVDATKIC